MTICDLCGKKRECRKREIEGREYDICSPCWTPLEKKLKGKGQVKKERETVFIPPLMKEPEPPKQKPIPGGPPKIWGRARPS